jgi:Flp pilus assembly protein TadG
MIRATTRRRGRRTRGQALVEFALVFPIIVLLLLAMFDMGRAVFIYNGLTNAAREGVRLAIVNQDKDLILERVQAMTFAGPVSNPDVDTLVAFYHQESDGTLGDPCATVTVGCIAVVTPTSDWTLITPVLSSIIGPITFEARSELPIELVCPDVDVVQYATSAGCPRQP